MSDRLWTLIPAAGESRRFKEAGYEIPKPLLKLQSPEGVLKTMLGHVVCSLPNTMRDNVVVALKEGMSNPTDTRTVWVENSKGQADTVRQVLKTLPESDRLLVLDCDMLLSANAIHEICSVGLVYDGVIGVTQSFDPNASRINKFPFPTFVVEKEPISEWAIISARYFRHIGLLHKAIKNVKACYGEMYLSGVYNFYPNRLIAVNVGSYVDFGTPERVEASGWRIVP